MRYVATFVGGSMDGSVIDVRSAEAGYHVTHPETGAAELYHLQEEARLRASDDSLDVQCLRYTLTMEHHP